MRHHRRHPLIDRIRDMLDHMEGKRLLEPPRADFHTDQMPMAPPYRGPDPGRAPGPILSNEEIVKRVAEGQQGDGYDWVREAAVWVTDEIDLKLYVLVATAVYDHGVVGVYSTEERARKAAEEIWSTTDGHHSFRIDIVEPNETYPDVFARNLWGWNDPERLKRLNKRLELPIEVDDRTADSSHSAEQPKND